MTPRSRTGSRRSASSEAEHGPVRWADAAPGRPGAGKPLYLSALAGGGSTMGHDVQRRAGKPGKTQGTDPGERLT